MINGRDNDKTIDISINPMIGTNTGLSSKTIKLIKIGIITRSPPKTLLDNLCSKVESQWLHFIS